jgi:hypothetical protein
MKLEKGVKALWIPAKPRKGAYGAAWGLEPVEVEIMCGPDHAGRYKCKLLDQKKWHGIKKGISLIRGNYLMTNYSKKEET